MPGRFAANNRNKSNPPNDAGIEAVAVRGFQEHHIQALGLREL